MPQCNMFHQFRTYGVCIKSAWFLVIGISLWYISAATREKSSRDTSLQLWPFTSYKYEENPIYRMYNPIYNHL